jgi:glycosyltransferase involved in cell wall biosynthesis
MEVPRSLALRTAYRHHAGTSGYRQILAYTHPCVVLGVDEQDPATGRGLRGRYRWLHELEAWRQARRHRVELVHILYGEEYHRFSTRLLRHLPVVATYHQPPEVLSREVERGDVMGRVYRLAHLCNRRRFARLAAAIVLQRSQREVLARVMPRERIHVIPLGVDLATLTGGQEPGPPVPTQPLILTVGGWLRDWGLYFRFLAYCREREPAWRFQLVCRGLARELQAEASRHPNLEYPGEVTDEELRRRYREAAVVLLPVLEVAGSNALNESLAQGCPVVCNEIEEDLPHAEAYLGSFDPGSLESMAAACRRFIMASLRQRAEMAQHAHAAVRERDWAAVAGRTLEVYRQVLADATR